MAPGRGFRLHGVSYLDHPRRARALLRRRGDRRDAEVKKGGWRKGDRWLAFVFQIRLNHFHLLTTVIQLLGAASSGWSRPLVCCVLSPRHCRPTFSDLPVLSTARVSLSVPSSWLLCLAGFLGFSLWASILDFGLDLAWPLLHPLPLSLVSALSLHGFTPICMSEDSPDGVIDLSLRLGNLRISISGPQAEATRFLQDITARQPVRPRVPSPRSESSFALVPESEVSSVGRPETREQIQQSFPEVPEDLLRLASRLSGSKASAESRIRRAWRAGCWAGAVLAGRCATPCRSEQLDVRPRVYVVLRASSLSSPAAFSSSASYFRAVGSFEESSLSHSFPSETEARAYCRAARVDFPEIQA